MRSRKTVNKEANPISLLHVHYVRGDIAYRTHALARLLVRCRRNIETHRPFCFNAEDDDGHFNFILYISLHDLLAKCGPSPFCKDPIRNKQFPNLAAVAQPTTLQYSFIGRLHVISITFIG